MPNLVSHNRGSLHSIPKPKDVFRIVFLGDSMTFGTGVKRNESYPNKLEDKLTNNIWHKKIDVINLGIPGYQTLQCYATMKHIALPFLEPDLIIYAFYSNDLMDLSLNQYRYSYIYQHTIRDQESFIEKEFLDDVKKIVPTIEESEFFLRANSSLYNELEYRLEILKYSKLIPFIKQTSDSILHRTMSQIFDNSFMLMPYFYPFINIREKYKFTYVGIKHMVDLAREKNVKFMLFEKPNFQYLFSDYDGNDFIGFFANVNPQVYVCRENNYLRKIVKERKIDIHKCGLSKTDDHNSVLGHQLLAEGLYDYLIRHDQLLQKQ